MPAIATSKYQRAKLSERYAAPKIRSDNPGHNQSAKLPVYVALSALAPSTEYCLTCPVIIRLQTGRLYQ